MKPKIIKYVGKDKKPWYQIQDKQSPYNDRLTKIVDQDTMARLQKHRKVILDEYDFVDKWASAIKSKRMYEECLAAIRKMRIDGTFDAWFKSISFDPEVGSYQEFIGEMMRTDFTKDEKDGDYNNEIGRDVSGSEGVKE